MFWTSSVHHQRSFFLQAVFADLVCGNTCTRHVQPLRRCKKNVFISFCLLLLQVGTRQLCVVYCACNWAWDNHILLFTVPATGHELSCFVVRCTCTWVWHGRVVLFTVPTSGCDMIWYYIYLPKLGFHPAAVVVIHRLLYLQLGARTSCSLFNVPAKRVCCCSVCNLLCV